MTSQPILNSLLMGVYYGQAMVPVFHIAPFCNVVASYDRKVALLSFSLNEVIIRGAFLTHYHL